MSELVEKRSARGLAIPRKTVLIESSRLGAWSDNVNRSPAAFGHQPSLPALAVKQLKTDCGPWMLPSQPWDTRSLVVFGAPRRTSAMRSYEPIRSGCGRELRHMECSAIS
jgi:hypothetical protein